MYWSEIQERDRVAVHADVSQAVDALLRGYPMPPEIRYRGEDGEVHIEKAAPAVMPRSSMSQGMRRSSDNGNTSPMRRTRTQPQAAVTTPVNESDNGKLNAIRIYPYGVARNRLEQAAKRLSVPAIIARSPEEADIIMTLRTYYRSRQQVLIDAEERGVPLYFLRSNTINQMEKTLVEVFNLKAETGTQLDEWDYASQVTEEAHPRRIKWEALGRFAARFRHHPPLAA